MKGAALIILIALIAGCGRDDLAIEANDESIKVEAWTVPDASQSELNPPGMQITMGGKPVGRMTGRVYSQWVGQAIVCFAPSEESQEEIVLYAATDLSFLDE